MKTKEAIAILEALDPNHEVTLDIGVRKVKQKDAHYINAYLPGQTVPQWIEQKDFWPRNNEITCKMH